MPPLLTTMRNTRELVSGEVYLLSALAALQKVVETLPHFISPYLEGVLSQVRRRPQQGRKSHRRGHCICARGSPSGRESLTLKDVLLLTSCAPRSLPSSPQFSPDVGAGVASSRGSSFFDFAGCILLLSFAVSSLDLG